MDDRPPFRMLTPIDEKSGSAPDADTANPAVKSPITAHVTMPEKTAQVVNDSESSTLSPTPREKSLDLPRTSTGSAPHSYQQSNPFDTDIEAMMPVSSTETGLRKSTTLAPNDCQVWPGQDHWKQRAKQTKLNNRGRCNCMARFSKRTRIILKIVIALLIVGIAMGVGFGISKPLGAPIWGVKDT